MSCWLAQSFCSGSQTDRCSLQYQSSRDWRSHQVDRQSLQKIYTFLLTIFVMSPRRRFLLKAAGAVGLGSAGVAYWQRRPILRRDDLNAIETALEVPVLNVSDPVIITDNHIEASYSWARAHVDTTENKLTDSEVQDSRYLQDAYEHLEGKSPEEIDDTGERHKTLSDYQLAVSSSAMARGLHLESRGGSPSDELQVAHETLGEELEAFESRYTDESLTRTVVQAGHAESRVGIAASRYSRAANFMIDAQYHNSVTWEMVETGRFTLRSAQFLLEVLHTDDATDRTADLEDRYNRLDKHIEIATDSVEWEYQPDVSSWAYDQWIDIRLGSSNTPEDYRDESQLARAVMAQTSLATIAETLSEFETTPGWRGPDDVETELIEDTNTLINEKQAARRELETTANEVGSDPLGKHLLQQTVQRIEQADSSLGRLQDNFRSYDNTEWKRALDRVVMQYRSGAAEAAVIPDIVELVTSED